MLTLRPYQEEAIAALNAHLAEKETNQCMVLPTGSGTTRHAISGNSVGE